MSRNDAVYAEEEDPEDIAPEPIEGVFTWLSRADRTPPRFVIPNLVPVGLTFIGAPPKSLKSTFTMAIATLIAGVKSKVLPPDMRVEDPGGTVMGFSAEATAGELLDICESGMGINVPDDGSIIIADDPWLFQLDDGVGLRKLLFWMNARKPRLVFIDPFAEFHSLDEKDSRQMIQMLRPIRKWAVDNGAAVVIVHHTRKKQGEDQSSKYTANDLRGSSALFGKGDGILIFTPHEGSPGLLTIDAKFKRARSWTRDLQFAAYGETGADGVMEVMDDVTRKVLKRLRLGDENQRVIAKRVGCAKSRVVRSIEALVRLGKVKMRGRRVVVVKGKHKVVGVMNLGSKPRRDK